MSQTSRLLWSSRVVSLGQVEPSWKVMSNWPQHVCFWTGWRNWSDGLWSVGEEVVDVDVLSWLYYTFCCWLTFWHRIKISMYLDCRRSREYFTVAKQFQHLKICCEFLFYYSETHLSLTKNLCTSDLQCKEIVMPLCSQTTTHGASLSNDNISDCTFTTEMSAKTLTFQVIWSLNETISYG